MQHYRQMDWREMVTTSVPTLDWQGYPQDFHVNMLTCAYCDTQGKFTGLHARSRESTPQRFADTVWEMLQCQVCANVTFVIRGTHSGAAYAQFPTPRGQRSLHEACPPHVGKYYLQALAAIDTRSWDGAVLLSRSALQAIMKQQQAGGGTLQKQIDDLLSRGLIVQSLRDWAHHIRVIGNEAAHADEEEEITEQDAREVTQLVGHVIQYLYVVPAQIQAQQARRAEGT